MSSFPAFHYDYTFSKKVIDDYFDRRGRGIGILARVYGPIDKEHIIHIFRTDQKKWNIFKKLVKLCERLSYKEKTDFPLIKLNCLTHAKYFRDWEDGKTWLQQKKRALYS